MKNTTSFRKKALLSSLAMLMVALIALSSATFAWFTSNPNATAKGLQLKATASKGLVIQTASHGKVASDFWGHTDYLNYDKTTTKSSTESIEIAPVSFDLTGNALGTAYTVEAAADDNYAAAGTNPVSTASADAYYSENIACKLTGVTDANETADLKITSMAITTTSAAQKTSIRVAIQYNDTLIGVYAPAQTTNNYLVAPESFANGTTTYSAFTKTSNTFKAPTANIALGEVGTDGEDNVTVTVYLDGEDANCCSSKISASDIVSEVVLNLTVA